MEFSLPAAYAIAAVIIGLLRWMAIKNQEAGFRRDRVVDGSPGGSIAARTVELRKEPASIVEQLLALDAGLRGGSRGLVHPHQEEVPAGVGACPSTRTTTAESVRYLQSAMRVGR